ncbi:MAG: hypothetical protein U0163_07605 [Gemmatimonadaceae bacterium]
MAAKPKGFLLIRGRYRVLGKNKSGTVTGFQPDGDSLHFQPDNPKLLDQLKQVGFAYRLSLIKSTQLRFEGIDALELHYQAAGGNTHQPRPLADTERDRLLTHARVAPVTFVPPANLTARPPAPNDGSRGYILSRSLEVHGRPVAFAFQGAAPSADGSHVHLDAALLRRSLNYDMLASGNAYPLFYETLFYDLRAVLQRAVKTARVHKRGLWAQGVDVTRTGVPAQARAVLEARGVCFPKLFRRIAEYQGTGGKLKDFRDWLEAKDEAVQDLETGQDTHFDTFVTVKGTKVSLTKDPMQLKFYGAKTTKAAWL